MNKKKLAPLLLVSLLFSQSPSSAIVGGPFDNNTVPGGGADGTYSGVMTGSNLIGFVTFGVGSYSGQEGNGRFAVFHEGAVHYGAVSGMADLSSKRVAAALLGVAGLPSETTGASGTVTSASQALTVRGSAEGAFSAPMQGLPQRILFEGEGRLSTTANSVVTVAGATVPTSVNLPTSTSNIDSGGDTDANVGTTASSSSSVLRSETPFKIRGSRTSTIPYSAINSYSALPPLTPLVPTATPAGTPTP